MFQIALNDEWKMLAFGLHLTILLKSCEHLYAFFMIFVYILYAVYSVTLWERGNKLEFVFHLFGGMPACAATISCTSPRADTNISPIVDNQRGTERRLTRQIPSQDRDRSRISIES